MSRYKIVHLTKRGEARLDEISDKSGLNGIQIIDYAIKNFHPDFLDGYSFRRSEQGRIASVSPETHKILQKFKKQEKIPVGKLVEAALYQLNDIKINLE